MRRLVVFLFAAGFWFFVAWKIVDTQNLVVDSQSVIITLIFTMLIGATLFIANGWLDTMLRPYHPQTVTLQTRETPNQIVTSGFWAAIGLFGIITLAGLVIYFLSDGSSTLRWP